MRAQPRVGDRHVRVGTGPRRIHDNRKTRRRARAEQAHARPLGRAWHRTATNTCGPHGALSTKQRAEMAFGARTVPSPVNVSRSSTPTSCRSAMRFSATHPVKPFASSNSKEANMSDEQAKKPDHLKPVPEEELDEEEQEFRKLRRDLPGAKGASAVGIVAIGVAKIPGRNEFFRTHPDFRPVIPIVDLEVGMEKQFFAVAPSMVEALAGIGISVANHVLYLTVTSQGSVRIVPVRCANSDGEQNEYARTKELGLRAGTKEWVRLYTDQENKCYRVFPAPADRF